MWQEHGGTGIAENGHKDEASVGFDSWGQNPTTAVRLPRLATRMDLAVLMSLPTAECDCVLVQDLKGAAASSVKDHIGQWFF